MSSQILSSMVELGYPLSNIRVQGITQLHHTWKYLVWHLLCTMFREGQDWVEVYFVQQLLPWTSPHSCSFPFSKQKGNGIAVWKVSLPHEYAQLYFHMYKFGSNKIHSRKQVAKEQQDFVASRLDHATQSLIFWKRIKSTHETSEDSVTASNSQNALWFVSVG